MQVRDYIYLGATQSLCPECLRLTPAKIIDRGGRVYFRKRCSEHGVREDFVCSDVRWYDRMEYSLPGKLPPVMGIEPDRGCPYDCGLCTEHEQHTCIGLLEITSSCNLSCPMCFAASGPGGSHWTLEACRAAVDRLVEVEGRPEVLQLSGGEPTIHPEFIEVLRYACAQPIDVVMINTNGIRIAHDAELVADLASLRERVEVYLQFDGFHDEVNLALRGEPLLDIKLRAIERLADAGVRATLVTTLQPGVNEDQIGPVIEFALARPGITGVSFQPATYTGRYVLPEELERRITFPDVVRAVAEQTAGLFAESDFMPLPCAHPNGHTLAYAVRAGGQTLPLARFVDMEHNFDLLANGIAFDRPKAKAVIEQYLARQCCGGQCNPDAATSDSNSHDQSRDSGLLPVVDAKEQGGCCADSLSDAFFAKALAEELSTADVLRITITSFMDAYNFDVRQVMKSCVHHVLPSGHVIPFSAYNVLYRDGHVPLPPLGQMAAV
jgi:hypothetical protein